MEILSNEHENRLVNLLQKDNTYPSDVERLALFFIISGNDDLYRKSKYIYNFKEHQIEPDCLHSGKVDLCSSSRALVRLAYNLFNGYKDQMTSPIDLLSCLGTDNFYLAIESTKIRFSYTNQVQSMLDDDELEI